MLNLGSSAGDRGVGGGLGVLGVNGKSRRNGQNDADGCKCAQSHADLLSSQNPQSQFYATVRRCHHPGGAGDGHERILRPVLMLTIPDFRSITIDDVSKDRAADDFRARERSSRR
jgi:hypothetical protein